LGGGFAANNDGLKRIKSDTCSSRQDGGAGPVGRVSSGDTGGMMDAVGQLLAECCALHAAVVVGG